MKRWIVARGLTSLLAAALLATFGFSSTEPVSTQDTDAIYDHYNQRLDAATFVPGVSREEAIDKAFKGSANLLESIGTSNLETRATVGLYTGPDNRGNTVENRKVWLVVIDNVPISFPSGPYTSPENRVGRPGQRQQTQVVVLFEADTGEEIWGTIAGRWVDNQQPPTQPVALRQVPGQKPR